MEAVVVSEPGGRDKLVFQEVPVPVPEADEVLIRVVAAGCNWADIQKRQDIYPNPTTFPVVLGGEVAGTIVAVGDGVDDLKVGQRVTALTGGASSIGGYAEFAVAQASYSIPIPDDMDFATAAAFPTVALTAYHLTHTAYQLQAGETLLIHAISGGVGLCVTQIAVDLGAIVLGTVGSAGKEVEPLSYGARRVIDRSQEDFVTVALEETRGRGVDLVIDSLGADILPRSFDALRYFGHLINIGEAAGYPEFPVREKLYERSTSYAGFEVDHARMQPGAWQQGIDDVIDWIMSGRLEVPIAGSFKLDDVKLAHEALESRRVRGKLILEVGSPDGASST